jgi:hypothetical protein
MHHLLCAFQKFNGMFVSAECDHVGGPFSCGDLVTTVRGVPYYEVRAYAPRQGVRPQGFPSRMGLLGRGPGAWGCHAGFSASRFGCGCGGPSLPMGVGVPEPAASLCAWQVCVRMFDRACFALSGRGVLHVCVLVYRRQVIPPRPAPGYVAPVPMEGGVCEEATEPDPLL